MLKKIWGNRWPIAIALIILMSLASARRLLPFPATQTVTPSGMIETWSRTYRLLPSSQWRVGRISMVACGSRGSTEADYLTLGFFQVDDVRTTRIP